MRSSDEGCMPLKNSKLMKLHMWPMTISVDMGMSPSIKFSLTGGSMVAQNRLHAFTEDTRVRCVLGAELLARALSRILAIVAAVLACATSPATKDRPRYHRCLGAPPLPEYIHIEKDGQLICYLQWICDLK